MANPTISQIKVGDITYDVCDTVSRNTLFNGEETSNFHSVTAKSPEINMTNPPSSTVYNSSGCFNLSDANDVNMGAVRLTQYPSGTGGLRFIWKSDPSNYGVINLMMSPGATGGATVSYAQQSGATRSVKRAIQDSLNIGDIGLDQKTEKSTSVSTATSAWTLLDSISIPGFGLYIIEVGACYEKNGTGDRILVVTNSNTSSECWKNSGNNSFVRQNGVTGVGSSSNRTILRSTYFHDSTTSGPVTRYLWSYQNSGAALNVIWSYIRIARISGTSS